MIRYVLILDLICMYANVASSLAKKGSREEEVLRQALEEIRLLASNLQEGSQVECQA